jgi:hypothetical protein
VIRPVRHDLFWVYPDDPIPWDAIRESRNSPVAFALEINDVLPFIADLPEDMRPPTQRNPHGGLPKNVWVGGMVNDVWPEILDVRSRVRFILVDEAVENVRAATEAWRCPNCGHRGIAPRPRACPHASNLCGDVTLVPQIQWHVDITGKTPDDYREDIKKRGLSYWPEEFPT